MAPDNVLDGIRKNFGKLIQEEVTRCPQLQVATRIGVSQTTISSWARGDFLPTIPNLWTVAKDRNQTLWELTKELSGDAVPETRQELLVKVGHTIKTMSDRELAQISHVLMKEITSRLIG